MGLFQFLDRDGGFAPTGIVAVAADAAEGGRGRVRAFALRVSLMIQAAFPIMPRTGLAARICERGDYALADASG
jgi:hypothetical protein